MTTIGLTYDLRSEYLALGYSEEATAEFDREDTIVAIEGALRDLGYATARVGSARSLVRALAGGDRWDLVFNICEGLSGIGREAQVPALLDLYEIPYTFSDPLVMSLTLHKGMTKRVVRDAGVPTTDFHVVEIARDSGSVGFEPPYFIKPVAEGTGKGVTPESIVRSREALPGACGRLLREFSQPVLVEPYLPGREFTVGIVGTGRNARVLGAMEVILNDKAEQGVYSYVNKEECEERVEYRLTDPDADSVAAGANEVALAAYRALGCRDAGRVDIRCDGNESPQFMEVNPLAGIHPEHSDLPIICNLSGIPYVELIRGIVDSALGRAGKGLPCA